MKYQFTLNDLTVGDLLSLMRAAETNDLHTFTHIADRYTVGGLLRLPYRDLHGAIDAFVKAFTAQIQETGGATSPEVSRILRQALGNEETGGKQPSA